MKTLIRLDVLLAHVYFRIGRALNWVTGKDGGQLALGALNVGSALYFPMAFWRLATGHIWAIFAVGIWAWIQWGARKDIKQMSASLENSDVLPTQFLSEMPLRVFQGIASLIYTGLFGVAFIYPKIDWYGICWLFMYFGLTAARYFVLMDLPRKKNVVRRAASSAWAKLSTITLVPQPIPVPIGA